MVLPEGVITKTLTVSTAVSSGGAKASLEVLIEPTDNTIVWAATSEPVASFFDLVRTGPDQAAVIQLPAVDQTGYINEYQTPVTDWTYTVVVRYLRDGRKVGQTVTKYLKPTLAGPDIIDFDNAAPGDIPIYQGPQGIQGLSAYQVALQNGFIGTVDEWLQALATGGKPPSFTYEQTSPSDTWDIEHNMGYFPGGIVTVNSANQEFKGEIVYIDVNHVRITMVGAQSGTAHLS